MGSRRHPSVTADRTKRIGEHPRAVLKRLSRSFRRQPCPRCGQSCYRDSVGRRLLHDLAGVRSRRPRDLSVAYSKHRCEACDIYFSVDLSDLAAPGSHYTGRVISLAVRLVLNDRLPYREASDRLWSEHRVLVPFPTIQNWVQRRLTNRNRRRRRLGS